MLNSFILKYVFFGIQPGIYNVFIGLTSSILYLSCISVVNSITPGYHNFMERVLYTTIISVLLTHSIICAVFVVGILKSKRLMIIPWLISHIIFSITTVIYFFYRSPFVPVSWLVATVWVMLIQIYIWFCGYAFYQSKRDVDRDTSVPRECNMNETKLNDKLVLEKLLFRVPLRLGNIILGLFQAYFCLARFISLVICFKYNELCHFHYMVIGVFIHCIACLLFVTGILKKNKKMLLPWLVSQILITMIVSNYFPVYQNLYNCILWIIIQVYFWLCGYSMYHLIPARDEKSPKTSEDGTLSNIYEKPNLFPPAYILKNVLLFVDLRIGNIIIGLTCTHGCMWVCYYMASNISSRNPPTFFITLMICLGSVHSILSVLFVVGILKQIQRFLVPWLFNQILAIIIPVVALIWISLDIHKRPDVSVIFNWIIIQSYVWYCGYSIYQRAFKSKEVYCVASTIECDAFITNITLNN